MWPTLSNMPVQLTTSIIGTTEFVITNSITILQMKREGMMTGTELQHSFEKQQLAKALRDWLISDDFSSNGGLVTLAEECTAKAFGKTDFFKG